MGDVVPFPGIARLDLPITAQPQPGLIKLIEQFLLDAHAGRVQSGALAFVASDGTVHTAFYFADTSRGKLGAVIGALETVKFRMLDGAFGGEYAPDDGDDDGPYAG